MMPDNGATDLAKVNFCQHTYTHALEKPVTTTTKSSMLQKDK